MPNTLLEIQKANNLNVRWFVTNGEWDKVPHPGIKTLELHVDGIVHFPAGPDITNLGLWKRIDEILVEMDILPSDDPMYIESFEEEEEGVLIVHLDE